MPLPGGPSAKAGIRYELLWTVLCMTQVMDNQADSIRIEPPGDEGEGVEFYLKTPSGTEYHQAKRQRTGMGHWSLTALSSEGVLSHFYNKLSDRKANCVFVSAHAADSLGELADRACGASSWVEFESSFISSAEWSSNFADLHSRWESSSEQETYERIKRIRVRTIDESFLQDSVYSRLEVLVDHEPANALDVLKNLAICKIHETLNPSDLWAHLNSRGFSRPAWSQDTALANTISELNEVYLAGIQPIGIAGQVVPRTEVKQILDIFDDDETGNTVLATGRAGVGKSSTISQTLSEIENRNWPLLSLRVDRLEPCRLPKEVGEKLRLPASPVSVLASIADGSPCLLIIDQLDAISLASGRNPEFFDCIGAILREAQHHPNMRVLSACRKFDVDNDHRLRDLVNDGGMAKEVPIGLFDDDTVRRLVAQMGLDAGSLNNKSIALLSLPVHLRLLSDIQSGGKADHINFQTSKELYDGFWRHKLKALSSLANISDIQRVTDAMLEHMNCRETLFVPESLLEEHHDTVSVMISENILVKDGSRVSFFHEGFFDYMFARTTVSGDFDLVSYILSRDQSLFIRAQVRQILLHQRGISPSDALWNVTAILSNEDIRTHVKSLVLSLLGSLDNPTEEEWRAIEPYLDSDLSQHVWVAINESPPWFDLLARIGIIERWLNAEDESRTDRAVLLLNSVQQSRPDRVAELFSPYVGVSAAWNQRLVSLIADPRLGASRSLFDIAVKAVESGAFDEFLSSPNSNEAAWHVVQRLVDSNPKWACEMIAVYCNRLLVLARRKGRNNPFPDAVRWSAGGANAVVAAANAAPVEFITLLVPFLKAVIEINAVTKGDPPWRDLIWNLRIYGVRITLADSLLIGIESSMRWLSQNQPDTFRAYANDLALLHYFTVQHLLVRSYEANGRYFADEAVEYLLSDPARLATGYSDSPHWATRKLLQATTPHCSSDKLSRLERIVLDYYPPEERGTSGRPFTGYSQLALLDGFERSRLSDKASTRLQELRRKFEDSPPSPPRRITSGWVSSPIPEDSAQYMSDDDWLRAIQRYSSDSMMYDPQPLSGGPIELSRVQRPDQG